MTKQLSSHVSPIELAKTVRSIKGVSRNEFDFLELSENLIPKEYHERVFQILDGTEQEDEFAIFCKLMGTCVSLNRIDQNPLIRSDATAPDFIGIFSPRSSFKSLPDNFSGKFRCFIEVKLSQKKFFKISKNDLQSRQLYARNFGLPLLFVIKFKPFHRSGIWLVIDSNELMSRGRKVSISDVVDSHTAILFDDYVVVTSSGLEVVSSYRKQATGRRLLHRDHGELVETILRLSNGESIRVDGDNEVLVNAVLDCFDFNQISVTQSGDLTTVISSIGDQARLFGDIVYRFNNLAKNEDGSNVYDAARAIASSDSKTAPMLLFDRRYVEYVFRLLNSRGQMMKFANIGESNKNYRRLLKMVN